MNPVTAWVSTWAVGVGDRLASLQRGRLGRAPLVGHANLAAEPAAKPPTPAWISDWTSSAASHAKQEDQEENPHYAYNYP